MSDIPFTAIDWSSISRVEHPGETGTAYWRTIEYPGLRVRLVEYSAGYKADHWCRKGHIVHCIEGEFTTEHENNKQFVLKKGMAYIVSDELSSHRSVTTRGATLLIIDGEFLK